MKITVGVTPTDPLELAQFSLADVLERLSVLPKYKSAIPGTMAIYLMVTNDMMTTTLEWVETNGMKKSQVLFEER